MSFLQLLLKLSSVSVFTSAIVLVTSMILGKIMEPQHFGEYSFLQSILMILVNVSSMAASLAISVFMYRSPQNKLNRILNNAFFTVLPVFFIVSAVFTAILSFYNTELNINIFLVLINVVMMSVCLMGIDYLRMKQNIRIYSFLFLAYTSSIAVFSVIGYLIGGNVFYVYVASGLALTLPFFYTLRIFSESFTIRFRFTKKLKTFMWSLKYGAPVVSSTAVMSFLVIGDKIILGSFVSKAELAQYSIAALIASTTLFLVNNFASAWGAFLFKKLPNLSHNDVKLYYYTTMKWLLISIPLMLIFYAAQQVLYFWFFEEKYPELSFNIFFLTASYCLLGVAKYFMGYLNYFSRNVLILYSALFSCGLMFVFSVYVVDLSAFGMSVSVLVSMSVLCLVIFFLTTIEVNKYADK